MELPVGDRVARRRTEPDDVVGRAGRRLPPAIERGRQNAAVARARVEALLGRCRAGQHRGAVERADARAVECDPAAGEDVVADVVRVGPHRQLRVIGEVGVPVRERVPVPGASRIGRLGDGEAVEVRRRRNGELLNHPTVGDRVVGDRPVPVVVRLAAPAEAAPQGVRRHRPKDRGARLVEHRELGVDEVDDVIRADRQIRVRRRAVHDEGTRRTGEAVADTVEIEQGRGRGLRAEAFLHCAGLRASSARRARCVAGSGRSGTTRGPNTDGLAGGMLLRGGEVSWCTAARLTAPRSTVTAAAGPARTAARTARSIAVRSRPRICAPIRALLSGSPVLD